MLMSQYGHFIHKTQWVKIIVFPRKFLKTNSSEINSNNIIGYIVCRLHRIINVTTLTWMHTFCVFMDAAKYCSLETTFESTSHKTSNDSNWNYFEKMGINFTINETMWGFPIDTRAIWLQMTMQRLCESVSGKDNTQIKASCMDSFSFIQLTCTELVGLWKIVL